MSGFMRRAERPCVSFWRMLAALLAIAVIGAPLAGARPAAATGSNVTGHVLDEHGVPVAGAMVRLANEFGGPVDPALNTSSGPDGSFTLNLPPGNYQVTAEPPGDDPLHVASAPAAEHVNDDGSASPADIELRLRLPNFRAHVQRAADAPPGDVVMASETPGGFVPVANAHVEARREGDFGPPAAQGMTDTNGDVALFLEGFIEGDATYELRAMPPYGDTTHVASESTTVTVSPDGVPTPDA